MSETATESTNIVTIEDAGPSLKKVSIEIPAEAVSEKLTDSLDTLAVEAQLPGFRKGRAPKQLLEKRLGTAIRKEAKEQLVASAFQQAVEEHKLKVVGQPYSEQLEKLEIVAGQPLKFEVEVEVVPEFEVPEFEGVEVLRPTFEVTDEMIAKEVEKLCVNEGDLEEREASEPGDYLTGRGVMKGKDTVHYDIDGAVIQIPRDKGGKGMILGVMVEDFATQVGTPKPGDTVTVKTKGPDQHEVEAIRGDDLTITFDVARIDRIIPAPVEKVLSQYGMESAEALNDTISARLTQRALIDQQVSMRQQIANHLIDNTTIDLPKRLSASQAERTLQRRRLELLYRGVPAADIESHIAELRAASADSAQRELKLFFILHQVAEKLDVKVSEAEINGRISQMAMEQGVRPEKMRQDVIQKNQVGSIYQQIREHKALDAVLAKAKVSDAPAADVKKKLAKA
ncbi:MAG: trigger factor [Phycisphaeraceae bacterium]|nr:trigger factor [Phycisphaeraceae bacterium]